MTDPLCAKHEGETVICPKCGSYDIDIIWLPRVRCHKCWHTFDVPISEELA